jgi:cysteinyl-tRNA synthetase
MTEIHLTNPAPRRKERFEPIDAQNVRVYVCGPTVYDRAHLGNGRAAVAFDVLNRLLRHVYGEGHVTFVRNITDIDDKINARARETGRDIRDITEETLAWYLDDMDALGVLRPDEGPRATEWVPRMVSMIEGLIAKGHAYEAESHVLFAVDSFADYGRLSGRDTDDMIAGARVEVAPYKKNPMDFVLWKPSDDDTPGWDSPWGRGRPGWHIECSAMSAALLGESFDIHGGGADLMFPHHENEIAQSACAHPDGQFARVWLHNEMLQVDGKKMSKSLGNFFTVRDLLDQGYPGEVIRLILLGTHYRKPMDWTEDKARAARRRLVKWFDKTDGVEAAKVVPARVVDALADDMNTHLALSEMESLSAPYLKAAMRLIGLPDAEDVEWFRAETDRLAGDNPALSDVLARWQDYRDARDFANADRLKAALSELGIEVRATPDGPQATLAHDAQVDAEKLEALT